MVPAELKKRPITLQEAREAGLTRRALQSRSWRRVGSGLYCWAGAHVEPLQLLQAWHCRLPNAVFTGLTAAWLYGLDVDPCHPIEVAVPGGSGIRSRPGLVVYRTDLKSVTVRALPAATLPAMFRLLRRRLAPVELVVLADAAMRLGLGRFHDLAEPAESPMETRLRWLLLQAGLPPPQVQARLSFGRADLYYPSARLVIEYDGANHRDRLIEDNRRQNVLLKAGFRLLRFTAADLRDRSAQIVADVRAGLRSAID